MREPLAYFITFTTYGTWLHGDPRGSVDRDHHAPRTPLVTPSALRRRSAADVMAQGTFDLDATARQSVLAAVLGVWSHRGWHAHAVHVRTTHVHVVVSGSATPEKMMSDFKSYASRALRSDAAKRRCWTRHGSTRYLWNAAQLHEKIAYVRDEQGAVMAYGASASEPGA